MRTERIFLRTFPAKPNSKVLNVIKIGATTLEEPMASLAKAMESIATSIKGMDDKDVFTMAQIEHLSGNNQTPTKKVQHQTLLMAKKIYISMETCNSANIDRDLMVKQLVWLLKGNVFDWYTIFELRMIYN
ncbi:hypothetical protein PVK06_035493 [Gossypium arboreum]|uniref:Uncharacterized protein n=1 Tax=Gossypium arboreum TaxID=29729 RepID=A0ABR0NGY6_GOSAR|nr:hypothetical protein PVK06_035493 [Gossypium arboreum]